MQRVIASDCDVAGRPARASMRVQAGQRVSFRRPAPDRTRGAARALGALHRPGLLCPGKARRAAGSSDGALPLLDPDRGAARALSRRVRAASSTGWTARPRACSWSRVRQEAESTLKKAFARRLVNKRYLAIVHGELDDSRSGAAALAAADRSGRRRRCGCGWRLPLVETGGLTARTEVRTVRRAGPYTLVECRPHTGRQHQIRVHLWTAGYPIVGDKLYPDEELFLTWAAPAMLGARQTAPAPPRPACRQPASFPHPRTGVPVAVDSPLPAELADFLREHSADN